VPEEPVSLTVNVPPARVLVNPEASTVKRVASKPERLPAVVIIAQEPAALSLKLIACPAAPPALEALARRIVNEPEPGTVRSPALRRSQPLPALPVAL
jgi:hypothetical protein